MPFILICLGANQLSPRGPFKHSLVWSVAIPLLLRREEGNSDRGKRARITHQRAHSGPGELRLLELLGHRVVEERHELGLDLRGHSRRG